MASAETIAKALGGRKAGGTLHTWQPRTSKTLSQEVARVIVENLMGFNRVLAELDARERLSVSAADEEVTPAPASNEADGKR